MKRTLILTLAAGAVAVVGIGFGMHAAESGNRGEGLVSRIAAATPASAANEWAVTAAGIAGVAEAVAAA